MSRRAKIVVGVVAVIVVLAAIGAAEKGGGAATVTSPPGAGAGATAAGGGSSIQKIDIGQTVTVGSLSFVVQKAQFANTGIVAPPAGEVYFGYQITIASSADNQLINAGDFKIAADGVQQGQQFAIGAPTEWQPLITFDTLGAGHSTSGWLTFQVPKPASFVELTYSGNIFSGSPDWKLDASCCS